MKTCRGCGAQVPGKPRVNAKCEGCKRRYNTNKVREWRLANPERHAESRRKTRRKVTLASYGLTAACYASLLEKQDGVCAVCGALPDGRALAIDHDHNCCPGRWSCGQCIRGLLCSACNTGLGVFRDNPTFLRRAANYLE